MSKITHIVFDHDGTLVDTSQYQAKLYDGVRDLVQALHKSGIRLSVWTARSKASTRDILSQLELLQYFDDICGSLEADRKPSADGIYYLLPEVKPENVIVIGDSIGDIVGGRSFGAHCIGAMWAHRDSRAIDVYAENGAKASFMNVIDCQNYINKLI